MNGKFLLDTNIVIALLTGDKTLQRPDSSDSIFVPCVVVGELFYGALNSNRIEQNAQRIAEFFQSTMPVPCDYETARVYGEIKTALRKKGRPMPDNDIWIAAVAKQHRVSLVTRDEHFASVDGLVLVKW